MDLDIYIELVLFCMYTKPCLCFIDPLQLVLESPPKPYYIEGQPVNIVCLNHNEQYPQELVWLDPNGNELAKGGYVTFTANRNKTGRYSCKALNNDTAPEIPSTFFDLVVHCKFSFGVQILKYIH